MAKVTLRVIFHESDAIFTYLSAVVNHQNHCQSTPTSRPPCLQETRCISQSRVLVVIHKIAGSRLNLTWFLFWSKRWCHNILYLLFFKLNYLLIELQTQCRPSRRHRWKCRRPECGIWQCQPLNHVNRKRARSANSSLRFPGAQETAWGNWEPLCFSNSALWMQIWFFFTLFSVCTGTFSKIQNF